MGVSTTNRLVSLDAFRGLTIAGMILVNNPGSWSYVYAPLRHAQWHGCTPTDLVFPFFLFIVGVAMRFSFKRFDYKPSAELLRKILWRTVSIFVIGLLLNAYPFIRQDWDWSRFRIMGVLQRIALCYGIASVLVVTLRPRTLVITGASILLGYWALLGFGGGYSLEGNLARSIDQFVLGSAHLYRGMGLDFDPEGLLSTIPAVVTVLLGYAMGYHIETSSSRTGPLRLFLIAGVALVVFGWVWGWLFPINKPLWTSSYVLFSGGWAVLLLTVFLWLVDVKGYTKAVWPLTVYGMNAIFVYVASGLWVKSIIRFHFDLNGDQVNGYNYLFETVFLPLAGTFNGSLLFAVANVFGFWLLLVWMYRKNLFVKI